MKRDSIVLGYNYILPGSDVGFSRPNANALIVGISGCGKSTSVILPTVGRLEHSNPILSYAKESDAYAMARYLKTKGYKVHILNINHPEKSTVSFDPVLSIESYEDIDALSAAIVDAAIKQTVDDYWQAKAKPLNASLITAALMTAKTLLAIVNLPPRSMMGIDSCGMLLSAIHNVNGEEKLNLVMLDDAIPAGAKLY